MFIFQSVFNVTQFSFLFIILNFSSEYKYYLAVCLTPGAAPWHHWCQPTTPTDHPHALLSRQRMPGADSCRGRVGMCRDGMGTMDGADGVPAARTCRTALSCQRHCEWNMNRSPVKSADTECQPVRVVHFQDCGTHLAMEPNRPAPFAPPLLTSLNALRRQAANCMRCQAWNHLKCFIRNESSPPPATLVFPPPHLFWQPQFKRWQPEQRGVAVKSGRLAGWRGSW